MLNARGENFNGKEQQLFQVLVTLPSTLLVPSLGAKAVTCSDSSGLFMIRRNRRWLVGEIKEVKRERIVKYAEARPNTFTGQLKADLAFPCATQNELDGKQMQKRMAMLYWLFQERC